MNILTPEARTVLLKERFRSPIVEMERNAMIHLEMLALAAKLKKSGKIKK